MKLRTQKTIGFVTLGYAGILMAASAFDIHPNVTSSLPGGLWREKPLTHIERGTVVSFCLPEDATRNMNLTAGSCPDTFTAPLIKPVAAIEGDTVEIKSGAPALVNGKEIPNTTARPTIPAFPAGKYVVKPNEIWLLSSYNPRSYDSRYYGPVSVLKIQGEAIPLLVIDNSTKATGERP